MKCSSNSSSLRLQTVRRACAGALLLVISLFASGCTRLRDAGPPQHLVLVTLDTLRSDRLGAYGYERPTSPNLDRLSARGVRFEDAISQAISTPPSHASILTGLNPPSHGLRKLRGQRLPPENETLAEILRKVGFVTAAFVSALPLQREVGLNQGFQFYDGSFSKSKRERKAGETNESIRAWMRTRPPGRLFLWVHYFDPHAPYFPPYEFRARFGAAKVTRERLLPTFNANPETGRPVQFSEKRVRMMSDLYDAEVSYTDATLGELLHILEQEEILKDAVIAVVADHGEHLGEYQYYFGHWDVFEETARVPMVLVHPRGEWAGSVITETVGTIDILPTVLRWLGISHSLPLDGRDLTPLVEGQNMEARVVYTEQLEYFPVRAVRTEKWLLIERGPEGADQSSRRHVLYDRHTWNRGQIEAVTRPEVKRQLVPALAALTTPQLRRESLPLHLPEELVEGLRALGYAD